MIRRIRNPIRPVVTIERRYTFYPYALFVLCMASAYLLFDYGTKRIDAERLAAKHEHDFTECLKGKWRHTDEDGTEWGCMEVEYNKPRKGS